MSVLLCQVPLAPCSVMSGSDTPTAPGLQSVALDIDVLTSDPPNLHGASAEGRLHDWALGPQALRVLSRALEPGWHTLETGAGVSTVVFALKQTHHTMLRGREWRLLAQKLRARLTGHVQGPN